MNLHEGYRGDDDVCDTCVARSFYFLVANVVLIRVPLNIGKRAPSHVCSAPLVAAQREFRHRFEGPLRLSLLRQSNTADHKFDHKKYEGTYTPLHSTPLHSTPLHSTPLLSSPLLSSPLLSSPLLSSPHHTTPHHTTPHHITPHTPHHTTPQPHHTPFIDKIVGIPVVLPTCSLKELLAFRRVSRARRRWSEGWPPVSAGRGFLERGHCPQGPQSGAQ